ncbi:hypothetical protein [Halomicrobium salinisoli]|uniref:hypothetical protein n=1 Tax=Halomicrobium salinisoli TaxID=2878391 RepID=UPI001CF0A1D1|nr:hypothetical protein [Halomicrobium salinisoli]
MVWIPTTLGEIGGAVLTLVVVSLWMRFLNMRVRGRRVGTWIALAIGAGLLALFVVA